MIEYEYDELNRLKKIIPRDYTLFISDIKLMMSSNQLIHADEPGRYTLSGITVTDSILSYINGDDDILDKDQIKKRQDDLYQKYNQDNSNPDMSMELINTILNTEKKHNCYNFGTTEYANNKNKIDYTKKDDVNKFMCHWLDYEVKNIPEGGKENIPVAVATENYHKWMLAIGFSTDRDPHQKPWEIPGGLSFNGIFVIIPFYRENSTEDPEFIHYIQSTEWNNFFQPIENTGGIYAAVLEPPETNTDYNMNTMDSEQDIITNKYLNQKIYAYSYAQPWDFVNIYNKELHNALLKNPDYQESLKRPEFKESIIDTKVTRMFKVERDSCPYSIIPYDRKQDNQMVTSMVFVMSLDGKFESVSVTNKPKRYFDIRCRWDAFFTVWWKLDNTNRFIINNWAANEKNYPLSPVYNTVTYGQIINKEKDFTYYNTVVMTLLHDNTLVTKNTSPIIEPIGSYPKGNPSYELTWKRCEEFAVSYQGDPIMYNLIINYRDRYQKLFEDSIYATGYKFRVTDPDGVVREVYSQNDSKQLYDTVKLEDDVYELSVPKDDTVSSLTITAVDNDVVCVAYNDENGKCEEYSRYGGGYSFYPFLTDNE
jgi:hypothetical protein